MRAGLVLVILLLAGCAGAPTQAPAAASPAPTQPSRQLTPVISTPAPAVAGPARGFAVSPAGGDMAGFFADAKRDGTLVLWAGDWDELGRAGSGADVVATLAERNGLTPVVAATFFEQRTGKLLRPLDDATKARYQDGAVSFVRAHHVPYLALGIEVNVLAEKDRASFDAFASWFPQVRAAVRNASATTKVFPVFQYERAQGRGGGLYGDAATHPAEWDLLALFGTRDLTAFTTYPSLLERDPAKLASDYYADAAAHAVGNVAFTEVGYPAHGTTAGWETTPEDQAAFVRWFGNATASLRPEFSSWLMLHDQATAEPFKSMGLVEAGGTPRPALAAWTAAG